MTDPKFRINGEEYDVPTIDTFGLGEAIVLHQYTGLTLDQLDEMEGLHPGVVAALLHVAVQRAEPGMKPSAVRKLVEGANLIELLESMPTAEDDEDPLDDSPQE